jgi:hypothetical protein
MAIMDSRHRKKSLIFMIFGQKMAFLVFFQILKFGGPPPGGWLKCRRSVPHCKNVLTQCLAVMVAAMVTGCLNNRSQVGLPSMCGLLGL